MTKQRYLQLAMILIVVFISGVCFLIWYINYRATHIQKPINEPIVSTPRNEDWQKGKLMYRSYCYSCHKPTENSLGPVLIGAPQRWHDAGSYQGKTGDQWLKIWVRNWKDVESVGYPYGVAMARSREAEMNMFMNLTDRQIDQILDYANNPYPDKPIN